MKDLIRNQLTDKSTINEYFQMVSSMYQQRIREYEEVMENPSKPSELRWYSYQMQILLKESLKISDVLELAFLNNADTQDRIKNLTEVISKMDIKSNTIKKKVQEIQNQIEQDEKSRKENKGLLKKFPFKLESFDINTGVFKVHFKRKKDET